jgi:hypothetical protein
MHLIINILCTNQAISFPKIERPYRETYRFCSCFCGFEGLGGAQLIIAPLLGRSCVSDRVVDYAPHALGGSERTLGAKTQVLNYQAQIELALA